MKRELTKDFDEQMRRFYPELNAAEKAVYDVMGVSMEEMRSRGNDYYFVMARMLFFNLMKDSIYPVWSLASFLNRDHASACHWNRKYKELIGFDKHITNLDNRLRYEYKKNIENGVL